MVIFSLQATAVDRCDPGIQMHHNPTVYTKGQSITTTLKVNRAKNRFLKQEQGGGGHDSKQPQESKVNVVSLWCHGIPEKNISNNWQSFSYLFDARTSKLSLKLKSQNGFIRYQQDKTANSAHPAALFCPVLVCPQKSIMGLQYLVYF